MADAQDSSMDEFESPTFSSMMPLNIIHNEKQFEEYGENKCNQYIIKNKTHIFYGGYEGIPENLLINFIGWICLLSLFTILRKKAWNYGRLALVQKYDNRAKVKLLGYSEYNVWTQLFYGAEAEANKPSQGSESDSVASYDFNLHLDKGTFSWITALFKIKDSHVLQKSGRDAVHYLSFQRHMIVYLSVVCIVCITVVLPINFQGTLEGGEKEFGHTTISNLSPSSPFMWIHITLAFMFLPLGIAFTRHHSRLLNLNPADLDPNCTSGLPIEGEEQTSVTRTIMITHVPRRSCHKDTLLRHFQEAYPDVEVLDLQFAYGIKDLILYDKERELAHRARVYCELYEKETHERLEMRPYKCGMICRCCDVFGCPKVDALEYYTQLESDLAARVDTEKVRSLQRPTGVAFVTLDSRESATKVLKDHKNVPCKCLGEPPASSVTTELKPHNWIVKLAPAPSNIYWKNLSVTTRHWWAKALLINLVLFVVLFFLTTPAVVINSLDFVFLTDKLEQMSPVLSEFFPTMLLWTMAALMPVLVAYSDQFMSHWTRSAENHAVMRKTFLFLLFMVIILPSLGLTSAKALVEWLADPNANNATYRYECIFLPDNGAFFVNYIITSAFIGTSLELIRFPELFMYMIRLSLARSEAETASVRRAILYEFQFGVQYAWMLLIFAMTTIYSISCPLITPFGLLYMIFKHLVDKYNIYFAYGPSRISKNIHATAVNFVMVSIVLLQLCLLFFSVVRHGIQRARSIYSLVLLCITMLVFITHLALNWFKDVSPIEFKSFNTTSQSGEPPGDVEATEPSPARDYAAGGTPRVGTGFFVPDVLKDSSARSAQASASIGAAAVGNFNEILNENGSTSEDAGGDPSDGLGGVGEDDGFYQGKGRSYGTSSHTAAQAEATAPGGGKHYQNYSPDEILYRTKPNQHHTEGSDEWVVFDASSARSSPVPQTKHRQQPATTRQQQQQQQRKQPELSSISLSPVAAVAAPTRRGNMECDVPALPRPASNGVRSSREQRAALQAVMQGQGESLLDCFAGEAAATSHSSCEEVTAPAQV